MQLQSILFCVQYKSLIDNPEKQKFAGVSPRGFFWTCFSLVKYCNFAFHDEEFLKFG